MRPIFSSVLAVLAGALVASACYSEREPPPSFRYACDADGDCAEGQSCIDGLCETPCTTENFAEVCVRNELVCLNGVCSSGCDLAKDTCPASQECVDLGIDLGNGGSSFLGGSSDAEVGVCMRPCTEGSCADAQVCIEGFCVPTCGPDMSCPAGLECQSGLCLPDLGTTSGGSSGAADGTDVGPVTLTTTDASSSDGGDSSSGGAGDTGGGT